MAILRSTNNADRPMNFLLFTNSFPALYGERFLSEELKYLVHSGHKVTIVPLKKGEKSRLPIEVSSLRPIVSIRTIFLDLIKGLVKHSGYSSILSNDLIKAPIETIRQFLIIKLILGRRDILKSIQIHDVVYFYWGTNQTNVSPYIEHNLKVSRFHGYDLYDEGPNQRKYLVFRKKTLDALDYFFPISELGKKCLDRYDEDKKKTFVFRLGVTIKMVGQDKSKRNGFHIVTCSSMIPLKRLDLLSKALVLSKLNIHWSHFGDGGERKNIEKIIQKAPKSLSWSFNGWTDNAKVLEFYQKNYIDLFVNCSKSEGVPVSAMEALGSGIPLFMSNVGGSHELIENTGILFSQLISPEKLIKELEQYLTGEDIIKHRKSTIELYNQKYSASKNYGSFLNFLEDKIASQENN